MDCILHHSCAPFDWCAPNRLPICRRTYKIVKLIVHRTHKHSQYVYIDNIPLNPHVIYIAIGLNITQTNPFSLQSSMNKSFYFFPSFTPFDSLRIYVFFWFSLLDLMASPSRPILTVCLIVAAMKQHQTIIRGEECRRAIVYCCSVMSY